MTTERWLMHDVTRCGEWGGPGGEGGGGSQTRGYYNNMQRWHDRCCLRGDVQPPRGVLTGDCSRSLAELLVTVTVCKANFAKKLQLIKHEPQVGDWRPTRLSSRLKQDAATALVRCQDACRGYWPISASVRSLHLPNVWKAMKTTCRWPFEIVAGCSYTPSLLNFSVKFWLCAIPMAKPHFKHA